MFILHYDNNRKTFVDRRRHRVCESVATSSVRIGRQRQADCGPTVRAANEKRGGAGYGTPRDEQEDRRPAAALILRVFLRCSVRAAAAAIHSFSIGVVVCTPPSVRFCLQFSSSNRLYRLCCNLHRCTVYHRDVGFSYRRAKRFGKIRLKHFSFTNCAFNREYILLNSLQTILKSAIPTAIIAVLYVYIFPRLTENT